MLVPIASLATRFEECLEILRLAMPGARQFRFEPTFSFRSLAELHILFDPV